MDDKTLMPSQPQDAALPTFLYREDYLLFGLLVRHGLVQPEHFERLCVAQQQDGNRLTLLRLLSDNSNLGATEQRNIQELLDLLATPKLREKLPAELPDVHTLVGEPAMPTVRDVATGPRRAAADVDTVAAGPPAAETLRASLTGRTLGATAFDTLGSTLTDAELTRLEKARGKGGLVGQAIAGHVILDRIGSGGQGDVYIAKQLSLNRYVALKKLEAPSYASPEEFVAAFRREAQTLGQINHARIVKVYEIFQDADNIFFTMEYINGKTLKDLISESNGPMPLDVVANLACQACSALARTAHDGLVHRDIKPANMLVDENGDLKIVDFGLAGLQAAFASASAGFVGTPQYASPEQCRLEPLTAATDQYSLGVTLYHALTGELPFRAGKLRDLLEKHASEPAKPPSTINEQLSKNVDRVIMRMLEKNPANRYATFDEVFAAWEQILHESSQTATIGARQLLGEGLLRLSRQDRARLTNQSLILVALWLAMALGTLAGEGILRRGGYGWVMDAAGWFGTGLLTFSLFCIFYVAAARKGWLPTIGSLRAWLYTHIATAIPSVLILMVHSGHFLRGIAPGPPAARPILTILISLVLIITAVSGSVGLLIFRELRRYLQIQQMQLRSATASQRELMLSVLGARLLSGWRLVHYPLAVFFILLTLLHIAVTIRFSGQ